MHASLGWEGMGDIINTTKKILNHHLQLGYRTRLS